MATEEKKMAAALAAVSAFMQQEQEALQAVLEPSEAQSGPAANLWGQSGRQSMMQLRNLMQLKALHRI